MLTGLGRRDLDSSGSCGHCWLPPESITGLTIFRYLLGNASAIRLLAAHPLTIPVGLFLVVTAGLARNYDQMLLTDSPNWFLGPLVVSCISGIWIGLFMLSAWGSVRLGESVAQPPLKWRVWSFMGLFWMAAPLAWLYAIPLERFCTEVDAARWNVALLAVVALWRVLLMARVYSVISGFPFWDGLGRVLLPASVEAGGITILGMLGRGIVQGMAGLRNSPAEDVLSSAMGVIGKGAMVAFLLGMVLFAIKSPSGRMPDPLPQPSIRRGPWLFLAAVTGICACAIAEPQREWRLTVQAQQLARASDWKGLAAFLSQHERKDFSPAAVLPPSPWEYSSAKDVPRMFAALGPETAPWVREMTVDSLEVLLSQERTIRVFNDEDRKLLWKALREQKEGPELLQRFPNLEQVKPDNRSWP